MPSLLEVHGRVLRHALSPLHRRRRGEVVPRTAADSHSQHDPAGPLRVRWTVYNPGEKRLGHEWRVSASQNAKLFHHRIRPCVYTCRIPRADRDWGIHDGLAQNTGTESAYLQCAEQGTFYILQIFLLSTPVLTVYK